MYKRGPYLCSVIHSHMRRFVAALQSMSHFCICHSYSLLCYLTSCSVVCHLFCFCKIYTAPLYETQHDCDVPALRGRYGAAAVFFVCFFFSRAACGALCSATKEGTYLCILAYFYPAQRETKSCSNEDAYPSRLYNTLHVSSAFE